MVMIVKVRDEDPRDAEICGSVFEMNFAVDANSFNDAIEKVKSLPRYNEVFASSTFVTMTCVK